MLLEYCRRCDGGRWGLLPGIRHRSRPTVTYICVALLTGIEFSVPSSYPTTSPGAPTVAPANHKSITETTDCPHFTLSSIVSTSLVLCSLLCLSCYSHCPNILSLALCLSLDFVMYNSSCLAVSSQLLPSLSETSHRTTHCCLSSHMHERRSIIHYTGHRADHDGHLHLRR